MTFGKFWSIALRHWQLVLICFVVGGVGAILGSKLTTPLYQSTALVQVAINSGNTDINNLLASDQLVQTEATLATSDPVLRTVASHYGGMTVDQLAKQVTAAPKLNTQLFEIDMLDSSPTRAAAVANDVAQTLIHQQLQMTQQETAQANFLILVQQAQPGSRPVQPNTLLNTGVGLAAGLFVGLLLAVLFEQFDTRVRSAETLAEVLTWPILSKIWLSRPEEVVNPEGQNINSEAYRILRTNIGLSVIDKPLHSLLITSAMSREGKSVIAANLAIFMAKAGKNTLLVDADLRRPTQHTQFGLPPHCHGLSNAVVACSMLTTANSFSQQQFLMRRSSAPQAGMLPQGISDPQTVFRQGVPLPSLEPFIHTVNIPNLRLIPAGTLPPNPSELLDSKAMQHLFQAIENCGAEVVIFDSPPLLGLSDTCILAAKTDATLMVVDIAQANKEYLKQAQALVQQNGMRVLGCVVNKQRRGRKDAAYAYYYSHEEQSNNRQDTPIPANQVAPISSTQQRL